MSAFTTAEPSPDDPDACRNCGEKISARTVADVIYYTHDTNVGGTFCAGQASGKTWAMPGGYGDLPPGD